MGLGECVAGIVTSRHHGIMNDIASTPITVRLSTTLLEWLDDARRGQADVPTRPEMVRRMLARQRLVDQDNAAKEPA